MNTRRIILIVAISLASGVVAFAAARNAIRPPATIPSPASATDPLFDWLGVSTAQRTELATHDSAFPDDLRKLRNTLTSARAALASSLEDPATPDAEIQSRVETVIATGNATERRISRYILLVRQHLTPDQQKRLLGLCAQEVRQGPGWCWRQGEGSGAGERRGPGFGGGNGNGPGFGGGNGNGPGFGGGNGNGPGFGGGNGNGPGFGGGNGPGAGGGRNRRGESPAR